MMELELGPIFRSSLRQRGAFSTLVLQVAASFTVGSWLLLIALWVRGMAERPNGFEVRDLVMATVREPASVSEALQVGGARDDLAALARLPGVRAVAPLAPRLNEFGNFPSVFWAAEQASAADRRESFVWPSYTSPAAVDVFGLRFIEGGALERLSPAELASGVVITRSLRDDLFPPPAVALGRLIASDDAPPARVLGVVENVSPRGAFMPRGVQVALRFSPPPAPREHSFLVRAHPGQAAAVAAALARVFGPSSEQRLVHVEAIASSSPRFQTFARGLVLMLALVGLTLAVIAVVGTVALTSFLVAERTHVIGVRRALGATRWSIVRYFLVESSLATAIGIALGLGATTAIYLVARKQFHQLELDARKLILAAVALWLLAALGALVPARRAARIPPSVAARGR